MKLVPDPSNGGMSVALGDVTTSTASQTKHFAAIAADDIDGGEGTGVCTANIIIQEAKDAAGVTATASLDSTITAHTSGTIEVGLTLQVGKKSAHSTTEFTCDLYTQGYNKGWTDAASKISSSSSTQGITTISGPNPSLVGNDKYTWFTYTPSAHTLGAAAATVSPETTYSVTESTKAAITAYTAHTITPISTSSYTPTYYTLYESGGWHTVQLSEVGGSFQVVGNSKGVYDIGSNDTFYKAGTKGTYYTGTAETITTATVSSAAVAITTAIEGHSYTASSLSANKNT